MEAVISKWGNSAGIRIPGTLMKTLKLKEGDKLFLVAENGSIICRKRQTTRDMFEEFYGKPYEEITEEDMGHAHELEWGDDVGGEMIR